MRLPGRSRTARRGPVPALAIGMTLLAGCGGPAEAGTVTVMAAASLTESFTQIAEDFESANPGVRVLLAFGPSDGLAVQIGEGAPADVFASASPEWMDVAAGARGVTRRADFARNELVAVVPRANPAGIRSFEDLAGTGVALVVAAPAVPAGRYAREAFAAAGIAEPAEANVVSNEEDVKAVLQRVALGEADAGVVYRTDLTPHVRSLVRAIEVPPAAQVSAVLQVAMIADTAQPEAARRFVAFLLGPGRAVLRSFGFLPP